MVFRIRSIDMDGCTCREHHPERGDIGKTVVPVAMRLFVANSENGTMEDALADDGRIRNDAINAARDIKADADETGAIFLWTCVDHDGNLLDLLDWEVELIRA